VSEHLPPWWDREVDERSGVAIRSDVRESAHKVWKSVCMRARRVLGDASDAPELLESAVRSVSRYLNKNSVSLNTADPGGLLVLAFYRSLQRLARQRRRFESIGAGSELAEILRAPDWSDEVDRRLFLEQLARELSDTDRAILRFRLSGYSWREIARMLQTSPDAVRRNFWREIRRAHLRLLRTPDSNRPYWIGKQGER
jgi:DNA-directed RNA polymerase specialized sigma24 family protein